MKIACTSGGCSVVDASLLPLAIVTLAVVALVGPACPATAHADACRIETSGASSPEWSNARASLAELALTDRDCVSVRIQITEDQARVLFTTADGRSAERIVATPAELRATIDALRVQGPAPRVDREVSAQAAARPAARVKAVAQRSASDDGPDHRRLRLALLTGARGGGDSLVSPVLGGALSLGWGMLELGAMINAEVQYYEVQGGQPGDQRASAAVFGVQAGLRQPIAALDVLAGGRAALAFVMSRNHDAQACPVTKGCPFPVEDDRTGEWRAGAYLGLSVPRAATLRFRTEVSAEVITPSALDGSLAHTPSWALAALVGLEVAP
jgi:hypothetical protein